MSLALDSITRYFDMELPLPIGTYHVRDAITSLASFFTLTLFISAVCYTGARLSLHYLTMRGSTLCDCCPGCIRSLLLAFLKKGGPIALNSLMIINTKLAWNEGGVAGTPSHVYGYSLGFGQLELVFFFVNVLFMIVSVVFAVTLFILPFFCAGMLQLCCKAKALQKIKTCGRGYIVMSLYILSLWGFLTTLVTAMLKYYREIGFDIPSTPVIALQAFPLMDLLMTLIMFPPNISIQLGSKISMVKLVGALRLAKVGAVCIPIGIDVFLQIMEWKYAGPPSKCCKVCFPCCGKSGLPKGGLDAKIDPNADLDLEGGLGGRGSSNVETVSDAADDAPQRLEEELQKAGAQLGERSSAELGALEDAPPQDGRESLALAKAGVARQLAKADAKAQQANKEGEEAEKNGKEGEAEAEGGAKGEHSA